jgi:GTPase involved in cell partitioning and DNA repair
VDLEELQSFQEEILKSNQDFEAEKLDLDNEMLEDVIEDETKTLDTLEPVENSLEDLQANLKALEEALDAQEDDDQDDFDDEDYDDYYDQ